MKKKTYKKVLVTILLATFSTPIFAGMTNDIYIIDRTTNNQYLSGNEYEVIKNDTKEKLPLNFNDTEKQYELKKIDSGKYTIKQIKSASGYKFNEDIEVDLTDYDVVKVYPKHYLLETGSTSTYTGGGGGKENPPTPPSITPPKEDEPKSKIPPNDGEEKNTPNKKPSKDRVKIEKFQKKHEGKPQPKTNTSFFNDEETLWVGVLLNLLILNLFMLYIINESSYKNKNHKKE